MARIGDLNSWMNRQVSTLLHYLSTEDYQIPEGCWLSVKPYGNCRERGFCLSLKKPGNQENVVFFEHRDSDSLCCIRWTGYTDISDVVRPSDIPEKDYPDKWTLTESWGWLEIEKAAAYVRTFIEGDLSTS